MPATIRLSRHHAAYQLRSQQVQHHVPRKRPREILDDSNFDQFAVELDLPAIADQCHPNVRRADAGQSFQFDKGVIEPADVRHQCEQLGIGFQHLYGIADCTALDRQVAAIEAPAQGRGAYLVIDEADDAVAGDDRCSFICHCHVHQRFSGALPAAALRRATSDASQFNPLSATDFLTENCLASPPEYTTIAVV